MPRKDEPRLYGLAVAVTLLGRRTGVGAADGRLKRASRLELNLPGLFDWKQEANCFHNIVIRKSNQKT